MGKIRGILLRPRVNTLFRRVFRPVSRRHGPPEEYRLRDRPRSFRNRPITRLLDWTHLIRRKAKAIMSSKDLGPDPGSGYNRVGQETVQENPVTVPKGHLAVYVGQKDGDLRRILVPVVYFNHPSFGDLLKESEQEYGFDHPGGITIPCRISEFERVHSRIKAGQCTRKLLTWKRSNYNLMA
ncbi:auxin-responsive SAUR36-like [Olea europaea subsp. europaea]|uniref:Auxin-responsive SAUR36-like n=1 Tax=Olea europaea subsp. europaea TaxID=158383 RepID=A0A8S0PYY5_OLEEU|nr:auxin-responsive SAUR36-like [Olea europaea subsp. europaea]